MEQKQTNGLGTASLIIGIIALLLSCCYGGILGIIGLIVGVLALAKSNSQKGCAIGGIITSIIAIIITAFTIILGASFIDALNDTSDDTPQKVSTSNDASSSAKPTTETSKKTKKKQDNDAAEKTKNEFKVGDTIETKTLRITFISFKNFKSDNEFLQPKDGYKYVCAKFEFENIGDSDEYVSEYDFEAYADGYSVEQSYIGDDGLNATLSKGKKVKGSIYFEVPKDTKEMTIEYETNFWTENKIIFIAK